jgi:hypothetical protein
MWPLAPLRLRQVVHNVQHRPIRRLRHQGSPNLVLYPAAVPAESLQIWRLRLQGAKDAVQLSLDAISRGIGVYPEEPTRIVPRSVTVQVFEHEPRLPKTSSAS